MSALSDFIAEVQRQAFLLEDAQDRDNVALDCVGRPENRRLWTRQDKNRLECEQEIDLAKHHGDDVLKVLEAFRTRRMRTRLGFVLGRLDSVRPLLARALAEAQQHGTYNCLAPLLTHGFSCHEALIEAYRTQFGDLGDLHERHTAAVEELLLHADGIVVAENETGSNDDNLTGFRSQTKPADTSVPQQGWRFDPGAYFFDGLGPFELTPTPLAILRLFAECKRRPCVLEKSDLLSEVWELKGLDPPDADSLKSHIAEIRSSLRTMISQHPALAEKVPGDPIPVRRRVGWELLVLPER